MGKTGRKGKGKGKEEENEKDEEDMEGFKMNDNLMTEREGRRGMRGSRVRRGIGEEGYLRVTCLSWVRAS